LHGYGAAVSFGAILSLAVALAMDAMAVSAARALVTPRIQLRHVWRVALFFGGSQVLMPLMGYYIGNQLGPVVERWGHWVAFGVLGGLGAKMLWEARGRQPSAPDISADGFATGVMLVLALATSIDALAAGVTLPLLNAPLALSLATIGTTTAALSIVGLAAGRRFGATLGRRLDAFGGLVLIGLGTKIVLEHLIA
jgi:manganese efflux pump family protein